MKVLVTGSAGFIGQWVRKRLAIEGIESVGLDRNPSSVPADIQCDILNAQDLEMAVQSYAPDALIHLAARVDLDEKSDLSAYGANIEGVRNVIHAIRKTPTIRRAIFTSSQLVCRIGYVPSGDSDYCPNTLYGQSKVLTEKIVREEDGGNVEWCLVRPTTVWGPGMNAHYQKMLCLIQRGMFFHCGPKPLYKSYAYAENIANQYVRLLTADAVKMERKTFYLADSTPLSLRDYANALAQGLGAPPIRTVPLPVARLLGVAGDALGLVGIKSFPFNSFRLNNILTEYVYDLSPTLAACGPDLVAQAEGVKRTVDWFKQQSMLQ